jgi:hypothetical protein
MSKATGCGAAFRLNGVASKRQIRARAILDVGVVLTAVRNLGDRQSRP